MRFGIFPTMASLRFVLLLVASLSAASLGATAEERLTIRLVHATNEGVPGASPELRDITGLLERNLPFRRFQFLESRSIRLPASETVVFEAGLTMRCEGDSRRLSVLVRMGEAVLLQTRVSLLRGTPLILGGFAAPGGRRLLILMVQ